MMRLLFILIFLPNITIFANSQNERPIDVTNDISAMQYMDIKLFVLKNGHIKSYSDVDNAVAYSFQNVDVYLNPCNLDPMVQVDTIMPEQNYCEMVLKIKFDSNMYNSFFQYISLKLYGNQVFLEPVYDDLRPNNSLRREDILTIVQNIIQEIGTSYEY